MKARKTSTPAALATGGGGEDLHIQVGGGMENEICNFKEELKMQMEKEFCHRRGWQHRALQLRGQLLQRGGVGGAGQHCGDFQGSRCWVDSWVPGCAPSTVYSWVPRGPSVACLIIDFLNKVADSAANYSKPWKLIHTTQKL